MRAWGYPEGQGEQGYPEGRGSPGGRRGAQSGRRAGGTLPSQDNSPTPCPLAIPTRCRAMISPEPNVLTPLSPPMPTPGHPQPHMSAPPPCAPLLGTLSPTCQRPHQPVTWSHRAGLPGQRVTGGWGAGGRVRNPQLGRLRLVPWGPSCQPSPSPSVGQSWGSSGSGRRPEAPAPRD